MRPGGGASKGSEFERKICVALSLWISHGERRDVFWRTAMSGGRATQQAKQGIKNLTQAGDVAAQDALGERLTGSFVIELKHVKNLYFMRSIVEGKGDLYKFWQKVALQAKSLDRFPMLIALQNHHKALMFTTVEGCNIVEASPALMKIQSFGPVPVHVCSFEAWMAETCPL